MLFRCQPQSRAGGVPALTSHSAARPIRDAMKELLGGVTRISAKDRRMSSRQGEGHSEKYRGQTECFASGLAAQARQFQGRLWKIPCCCLTPERHSMRLGRKRKFFLQGGPLERVKE